MLAAIAAAEAGSSVKLLEKNEKLGKKIYITGKGRCNLTNACDFDTFLQNVTENQRFLYSSLRGFFNRDICELLESHGCRVKTERGNRVFPLSDHASDVTKALERALRELGVEICLNTEVTEISRPSEEGPFSLSLLKKEGSRSVRKQETVDAVIVCTGGLSYATTGSTGDGYRFAEDFGLACVEPCPSLVPLTTAEKDYEELQGLSLKNVSVRITPLDSPGKVLYEEQGEMLFTHFGLSGPLILTASAILARRLNAGERFVLSIDLKPGLTEEKLDERILRDFSDMKNMDMKNALGKLLPSALRPLILRRARILPEKKVHDLTREDRKRLVAAIKNYAFTLTGTRGFTEAVITKGGVSVKEIDPKTMEAKKVPGLYFAGEVLDIDAFTGGFNLQLAWSTGYAAGKYAGTSLLFPD